MKKKIILSLVIMILLAVVIFCGINAYKLAKIDYNLQLENNGFVKDDITMLSHEQSILLKTYFIISVFGILGILTIIITWGLSEIL